MTKSIFKSVFGGILFGAAAYFMPFLILSILILFAFFRLFASNSIRGGRFYLHRIAWADKIRSMSNEEYDGFKQKMSNHYCSRQDPNIAP